MVLSQAITTRLTDDVEFDLPKDSQPTSGMTPRGTGPRILVAVGGRTTRSDAATGELQEVMRNES